MEVENKYVTLKNYINGNPSESNLEITSTLLSLTIEEGSKDMIVKDLYVVGSKKILLLQEIDAFGIWRVVASGNPGFQKDDLVGGVLGWEEYSIYLYDMEKDTGTGGVKQLMVGFTTSANQRKAKKLFVSAASASVGNLVRQFAKLSGCYVVSSAGSKKKVVISSLTSNFEFCRRIC
ncbi:2-alkenal reductase (NADP(+)-dependent)-like [Asparagus officinalis]|uniref:2-alkenal reductase (NADP(+)-dependent)-like n=1 Tax=Asparagus officinalis TaxID=4686 RepID=UPI00098E3114|nr:2-alkenal reductase (NADP(+)-dependent)-like [Asparagus officinalis]